MIFYDFLGYLGHWSPKLVFVLSILLLIKSPSKIILCYLLGQLCNTIFNYVAKDIIRQPRPSSETFHYFKWNSLEDQYCLTNKMGAQKYGMPSGHAQSVAFSLIFIHYALRNSKITTLFLFLSLITIIQRVIYQNHSIEQVLAGTIVGACLGYVFWNYATPIIGRIERNYFDKF